MFDWLLGKRHTYLFTHERGPTVSFTARSEDAAWGHYERFLIQKMFGAFAMVYDPAAVQQELKKTKCEADDEQAS